MSNLIDGTVSVLSTSNDTNAIAEIDVGVNPTGLAIATCSTAEGLIQNVIRFVPINVQKGFRFNGS